MTDHLTKWSTRHKLRSGPLNSIRVPATVVPKVTVPLSVLRALALARDWVGRACFFAYVDQTTWSSVLALLNWIAMVNLL